MWIEKAAVPWWWGHYDTCSNPVMQTRDFAKNFLRFPGGPVNIQNLLWPTNPYYDYDEEEQEEDIEENKTAESWDSPGTAEWIPQLKLRMKDKREILDGEMLSDMHVYAAQALLQAQFPWVGGFQDSCLSQTEFVPAGRGGLQIHHTRGNHWVLSSSLGSGYVKLYDSMYSELNRDLERQFAEIYTDVADPRTDQLYVDIVPCQSQRGSSDCALFAIAWAFELCQGRDFSNKRFIQSEMRDHFIRCLEQGEITSFPMEAEESFRRPPPPNIAVVNINDYL